MLSFIIAIIMAVMLLNVDNDVAITNCDYGGCDINVDNDNIIYDCDYSGCNVAQC